MFTGVPPFANTPTEMLMNVIVDRILRPPRPKEEAARKQGLGNRMWAVLEACWSAEPNHRPSAQTISTYIEACRKPPVSAARAAPKVTDASALWIGTHWKGTYSDISCYLTVIDVLHKQGRNLQLN